MTSVTSREVHLVRRPEGRPTVGDVDLVTVNLAVPRGSVLVRNTVMSVEPYMRGRMAEGPSYVEPFALGAAMSGHAIGVVERSDEPGVPEGSVVLHEQGWRERAALKPSDLEVLDVSQVSATDYLGPLGVTGMTAWVGIEIVASTRPGDVVFVSSAAGAVGAVAGQLAKAKGCTVIGSAGSPDKVATLIDRLHFDAAFDYHDGPARKLLPAALESAGEEHLDVYFDNVGAEQLEAAIRCMRDGGRIALCGAIAVYNATEPVPGPRNLLLMIWRRLRMEGFLVGDHDHRRHEFRSEMTGHLASGRVVSPETVVGDGIEQAFDGFMRMLDGDCVGKALVRIGD